MNPFQKTSILIRQTLLFTSFDIVGKWWTFKEVISPFTRLYLITEGEGWVYYNNQEFHLTPGKLFLIPKFTFHSYKCNESMGHFYLCFLDEIIENVGMYDLYQFNYLVDARPEDYNLFERLNELNPGRKIINPDPATYDNKNTVLSFSQRNISQKISEVIETQGIMLQFISRFIEDSSPKKIVQSQSKTKLSKVCHFIEQNLNKKMTISDLSGLVCLSDDYFSKIFNDIMGVRPMEYINRKRIERAQMLLVTTNLSICQVAEKVGIPNNSYFSTLFKKFTLTTPEAYQKMHYQI
jgi:AraC-like DNA-binding protein